MKVKPRLWSWNTERPDSPGLGDGAKDVPVVWLARITDDLPPVPSLISLLTNEERARLQRFRMPDDQQRFLVGRALVRIFIGAQLDLPPEHVELNSGPFGKPFVVTHAGQAAPHFNVSHSGKLVLAAFHLTHEVGVDVEEVRPHQDWEAIARRMFSADEFHALAALNAADQPGAFFQSWTRHEARLKTLGLGLSAENAAARDLRLNCFDLELPAGYHGAVACSR